VNRFSKLNKNLVSAVDGNGRKAKQNKNSYEGKNFIEIGDMVELIGPIFNELTTARSVDILRKIQYMRPLTDCSGTETAVRFQNCNQRS
jgi:hypothetical protein